MSTHTPLNVNHPCEPLVRSCPGDRSESRYCTLVDAFDVAHADRYRVRDTSGDGKDDTFCNIFAADVCAAMGVVLPRIWFGPLGWREVSANGLFDWLGEHGERYEWARVTAHQARAFASQGMPTLACWRNDAGSGHIAVVLPSPSEGPLRIAQAGARCFFDEPIAAGFGARPVTLWSHP